MKTTVEIADSLLKRARKVAANEGSTLRALIEEGLRQIVENRRRRKPKGIRRASFKGRGLHPSVQEGSWERIRELIYEGRGS
jgi:hypothetical protein